MGTERPAWIADGNWKLVFGYRHVLGVPMCPCADPGNYLSMEQDPEDPLHVRFRCWCGRTIEARMEDQAEFDAFMAENAK